MLQELRLSRLWQHSLVHNTISLFGVQAANYLIPLVTVPYLARVLGARGWGVVAFAQSFAFYPALLGEYGFMFSGTREVARNRESRTRRGEVLAGVLGAKVLLACASVAIALLIRNWIPILKHDPLLFWAAIFLALAQAFNMMWFFQGIERMRLVAALDISSKALGVLGILVFVHSANDGWLALAVQAAACFVSVLVGLGLAYRSLSFQLPSWWSVSSALRMGWTMFLFRSSVTVYTTGNAFLLGLFVRPEFVGYYAGAEKICKALLGLLHPVSQALYPRISYLVQHSRKRAAQLANLSAVIMGTGGALIAVATFIMAPMLIRLILGTGFAPAVPVLRVLSLLIPLISLSLVFGIQWMLPLGLESLCNRVTLTAGVINIVLAAILAPLYSSIGMAWAVVCAELYVCGGVYLSLRLRGLDPHSYSLAAGEQIAI
ncbi:MAG: flippase [Acidobacteria bacterium]|nr:flippase [Acidobacteriota bacterium]